MQKTGVIALAVVALAQPLTGQTYNARIAKGMSSRYQAPLCTVKGGDFRISSAATYLKSGIESSDPVKRESLLKKGAEVATDAIKNAGQDKSGAAWYYLGRLDLWLGDLRGADSAFTRAVALLPECSEDIKGYRQSAWTILMLPATEAVRANKPDSAIALLTEAGIISREFPQGFYNLGVLYANQDQFDSAAVYFKLAQEKAAAAPNDKFTKERNTATFNLAAVLQRANRHADAVAELKKYVQWEPNDKEAKKALVQSLRLTGATAEAAQIEQQMLSAGNAEGTLTNEEMTSMAVNLFNEKKYPEAADMFEKVAQKAPGDRTAWANLANTYVAMKAGDKLIPVAQRLVAMEPLNEESLKLLGEGYREINKQDSLVKTVERIFALPTSVAVAGFQRKKDGATLTGTATGRQAQTVDGKNIPAAATNIVVDFLNAEGGVVSSADVAIPALQPGAKFEWSADGKGEGIQSWRYRAK